MPRTDSWATHYKKTLAGICTACNNVLPAGVDLTKIGEINDRINALWVSEDGTWEEFQRAVGEIRMEFFKTLKEAL